MEELQANGKVEWNPTVSNGTVDRETFLSEGWRGGETEGYSGVPFLHTHFMTAGDIIAHFRAPKLFYQLSLLQMQSFSRLPVLY